MKYVGVVALAALLIAWSPPAAQAVPVPVDPHSHAVPAHMRLSPQRALELALATDAARKESRRSRLKPVTTYVSNRLWDVQLKRGETTAVDVVIDDRSARVTHVYSGLQAASPLALGEHGPVQRRMHTLLVIAGVLFLIPFFDPRRPFRLLHLDLLAMLGIGIYHYFFVRGHLATAVPLVYPVFAYLLVRVVLAAFGRPPATRGALIPWLPLRPFIALVALVVAARVAINLAGGFGVMEGGYDSVWGAATIRDGYELYALSGFPLNVYGPVMYLAYIPFEFVFPLQGGIAAGKLEAAHAAAVTWDLLTITGLIVLGRRLRAGRDGLVLGLALAFAFATYPWTVAVIGVSTNDGLVPMLLVWTLVFATSLPARGVLLGLATAAKLFPLPMLPALARGPDEPWSWRRIALFTAIVSAVVAAAVIPYLPHPGGLDQFLDLTARTQLNRNSPLSIWGLHPSLEWLQTTFRVLTALLAAVLFFVPRQRTVVTLAGAMAALIIAEEVTLEHWYYLYASWFAAFVLIVLFAPYAARPHGLRPDRRTEEHPAARA